MKLALFALLGAALAPTAAFAQSAPAAAAMPVAAGSIVYDPQGGEVGKIESVSGENVVLDTGTNKAALPKSAFAASAKGLTINATKAQIDSMVAAASAKSNAALEAALVPGAEVRGKAGFVVGTITEIKGDQVIINRPSGAVSLAKTAFAVAQGGLVISLTSAELEAAAQSAAQPTQ